MSKPLTMFGYYSNFKEPRLMTFVSPLAVWETETDVIVLIAVNPNGSVLQFEAPLENRSFGLTNREHFYAWRMRQ